MLAMTANSKVVLITGCSSGIGAALVRAFVEAGHRVAATARDPETLAPLAGDRVGCFQLDVTDSASIEQAVAAVLQWAGAIDVLVNNAGFGLMGPVCELRNADLSRQLTTNLVGPVAMVRAVVPEMAARGSGRIVNMGSVSGVTVTPFAGAYCASKAALHALSEALRMELAPFGITVITAQPGAVESRFGATASAGVASYGDQRGDSLYGAVVKFIEARARLSEERATPAAECARELVRRVMASRPPTRIRLGRGSWLLPMMGRLPMALRDRIMSRRFGLNRLNPVP